MAEYTREELQEEIAELRREFHEDLIEERELFVKLQEAARRSRNRQHRLEATRRANYSRETLNMEFLV